MAIKKSTDYVNTSTSINSEQTYPTIEEVYTSQLAFNDETWLFMDVYSSQNSPCDYDEIYHGKSSEEND